MKDGFIIIENRVHFITCSVVTSIHMSRPCMAAICMAATEMMELIDAAALKLKRREKGWETI